jgi:hypothetical protein
MAISSFLISKEARIPAVQGDKNKTGKEMITETVALKFIV